jgi:hypothetical protein
VLAASGLCPTGLLAHAFPCPLGLDTPVPPPFWLQQCELLEHIVKQRELRSLFYYVVATMTSDHTVAAVTLDNIVSSDIIVAFVLPLVALLTSSMM